MIVNEIEERWAFSWTIHERIVVVGIGEGRIQKALFLISVCFLDHKSIRWLYAFLSRQIAQQFIIIIR